MEAFNTLENNYNHLYKRGNHADNNELLELIKYFNFFNHPVKAEELYKYASSDTDIESIKSALIELKEKNYIHQKDEYYFLSSAKESIVEKRIAGEQRASLLLRKAKRVGRFISLFPFVKFVGISGSLSKNYADDKTDFDFFIITANNTLWICRTILHFVKKLSFLIGKQHALCMNYFIDEHHLRIEQKNIFIQIELSTLVPVYNKELYKTFLLRNTFNLPNIQRLGVDFEGATQYDPAKQDKKNSFWKPLNTLLMKLTDTKWKSKWQKKNYPMDDYDLAFKTTPFVSKNHPKNYQKRILQQLQKV